MVILPGAALQGVHTTLQSVLTAGADAALLHSRLSLACKSAAVELLSRDTADLTCKDTSTGVSAKRQLFTGQGAGRLYELCMVTETLHTLAAGVQRRHACQTEPRQPRVPDATAFRQLLQLGPYCSLQGYSTGTPAKRNRGSFGYLAVLALYVQVGSFSIKLSTHSRCSTSPPNTPLLQCSCCMSTRRCLLGCGRPIMPILGSVTTHCCEQCCGSSAAF